MKTYIVLLRGVTPTGKNRVPMTQLREVLAKDGFADVQTWIQSGNVVLRSNFSATEIAEKVNQLIKEQIGADLKIIVKTPDEMNTVLSENPFGEGYDISRVFFTLFNDKPDEERVAVLQSQDFGEEQLVITSHAIYLYIPGSAARSKLSNNFIERKLKINATTRNFNTLNKMVSMSSGVK